MGKVKLTLSIEESLIQTAKEVAQEKKVSLSEIISSFLVALTPPSKEKKYDANQLYGIARSEYSKLTDKELRDIYYLEKHGL